MPVLGGTNIGGAVAGLSRSISHILGKTIDFVSVVTSTILRLSLSALKYMVMWITRRAEFIIRTLERLTREFVRLASRSPEAMIGAYVFFREVLS